MKNLTQVLVALFCLCMPALLHAQRDDSKYLAGAFRKWTAKWYLPKISAFPHVSRYNLFPSAEVDGRAFGEE